MRGFFVAIFCRTDLTVEVLNAFRLALRAQHFSRERPDHGVQQRCLARAVPSLEECEGTGKFMNVVFRGEAWGTEFMKAGEAVRLHLLQPEAPAVCVGRPCWQRLQLRRVPQYRVNELFAMLDADIGRPSSRTFLPIPFKSAARSLIRQRKALPRAHKNRPATDEISDQRFERVKMQRACFEFGHARFFGVHDGYILSLQRCNREIAPCLRDQRVQKRDQIIAILTARQEWPASRVTGVPGQN